MPISPGREARLGDFLDRSRLDPRVEVRSSYIEGRGLFAIAPIAAGETVSVIGGRVLIDNELVGVGPSDHSSVAIDDGVNLVQAPDDDIRYGNHSCDPNLWMADAVTLIARRSIATGEELTIDYAIQSGYEGWSMVCRCGAPNCRGVVTGRDWRDPVLQRRYAGHWSPFLQRRIDRLR
jgi:SET domain-containing protein